jgi:predicted dithiol-disulfide oxidoreductase (DUF899 family)
MGWSFPWLSSFGSDFNYDFHVTLDEATGLAHRIGPLSNWPSANDYLLSTTFRHD